MGSTCSWASKAKGLVSSRRTSCHALAGSPPHLACLARRLVQTTLTGAGGGETLYQTNRRSDDKSMTPNDAEKYASATCLAAWSIHVRLSRDESETLGPRERENVTNAVRNAIIVIRDMPTAIL